MALHYHDTSLWVLAGMVALGLASMIGGVWFWSRRVQAAKAAESWPSVAGEVRSAEIVVIPDSDGPDLYEPRVFYRYRAHGMVREGDRLRVGGRTSFTDQLAAKLAIQPYRPGERVTVYYDPDRPDRAVLEPVPNASGIGQWLIFGAFLMAAAGYCFVTITWPSPFNGCAEGHACVTPQR